MSYEEIITFIGKGNGMYPKEVEKRFVKCRKVFDSALLDCKDYLEQEI